MRKIARKTAIRLLMLAICATALTAVPMVTSARAAADGGPQIRKHKNTHKSPRIEQPKSSSQAQPYYANPADNPDRKVSY